MPGAFAPDRIHLFEETMSDPFVTIDGAALETVSGGGSVRPGGLRSANTIQDPMLALLTQVADELQQLVQQQQSNPMEQFMKQFFALAMKNRLAPPPTSGKGS